MLAAIDRLWASGVDTFPAEPMIRAASAQRADLIEPLLQRGFDINAMTSSKMYPLCSAIDSMDEASDPACVVELLRLGADWRLARHN